MADFAPHIQAMVQYEAKALVESSSPNAVQDVAFTLAFQDARKAYHENRGGDALKALGAFWNIYLGYLDAEPEYAAKAKEVLEQRKIASKQS